MAAISQETIARAYELQLQAQQQQAAQRQADLAAQAAEAEATRSNTWGEAAANVPVQLLSGAVGLGQAVYGLGNLATGGLLDRATGGFSQNFPETQQILQGWQSAPTQRAAQNVQAAFDNEGIGAGLQAAITSPAYLQQAIVGTLPSLIPAAGAARLAAGTAGEYAIAQGLGGAAAREAAATAAERAVLTATGAQVGGQTNVDAINAIREAGGTETQQQLGGIGAGLLAGAAGAAVGKLTGAARLEGAAANLLPGGARTAEFAPGVVAGVLGGAAREGTEEAAQSATQQMAQNAVTPGKDLFDGVGQQAAVGGLLGGLLGGSLGGAISMSTPRSSENTPLGQQIRSLLGQTNSELEAPLAPNALSEGLATPIVQDVEEIDIGATPLPQATPDMPVEEIDLGATPVPLRSLYDITGRTPTFGRRLPALPQVEEVAPAPRPGLLGILDAQRGRGQLGGSDLAAGPLPWEGAFPEPQISAPVPEDAPSPAASQAPIDFNAPVPTWKQQLAKELGLKPASFRGKVWDQFVAAADQAGIKPGDTEHEAFLQRVAPELAADPASAPLFAARLAEKYAPPPELDTTVQPVAAQATAAPASTDPAQLPVVADWLQKRFDAIRREHNIPEGADLQRSVEEGLNSPNMARSNKAQLIRRSLDEVRADLTAVQAYEAANPGTLEQLQADGGVLDSFEPIRTLDPQQVAGPTPAERTAALRAVAEAQREVDAAIEEEQGAAVVAQALLPHQPTQPATPGAPGFGQPIPLNVEQKIRANQTFDPTITPQQAAADAFSDFLMDAPNPSALDETFIGIKQRPEWATLTEAQQNEIINDFELRYAAMEERSSGKFDRAQGRETGKAIPTGEFQQLVAAANRNKTPRDAAVVPVESVADFQALTGQAAPNDARGVFSNGQVYLIRENLGSPEDLAITLAHERGHHGLDALLGDRLPAVINRLWTNPATRKRIKAKMNILAGNIDPENGSLRRLAAEEVLADMFAAGEKVNGDVVTKARNAIEQSFATLLGVGKLRMSNNDVDAILRDVSATLTGNSPVVTTLGNPVYRELPDLMADPNPWTAGDARFSRAIADLNEVAMAAEAEHEGTRRNISNIATEIGRASLDKVKGLGTATATDKARSLLLDAIPLNQLANLYDKTMEGRLSPYARLKRGKESAFNKTITQERQLKYRDEDVKTSPIKLAKDWESFNLRQPAKKVALNQMQQTATLYRVWPDRPMSEQSAVDYSEAGFTQAEREQAHADVSRLWKAVGPEGQAIFKQSQALYSDMWNGRFEALRNQLARTHNPGGLSPEEYANSDAFKRAFGNTIDSALNKMRNGPYSPLQRYGEYFVTVRDKDGKIAWFSGHDTIEQAAQVEQELRTGEFSGPDYRIARTLRNDHNWALDGINQNVIKTLENSVDGVVALDNPALRNEIRQALVEAYLQSLPQSSFLQHANTRKNTKGATTDAFRAFSDYSIKSSRSTASLNFDDKISNSLSDLEAFVTEKAQEGKTDGSTLTKMGRVLNAVKGQHVASMNFERSPVADMLSAGGFLWFMSSPSQLFINSMQIPMVTIPRLAGTYGNSSALKAMRSTFAQFAKSRGDLRGAHSVLGQDTTERRVLDALYDRGVLDFTLSHDMTGLANGEASAMSGHWRKVMEAAGFFMHKSEVFNRQVTALAAAKLEAEKRGLANRGLTDEQIESLANAAEEAVLTTQFDYSQSNKPKIMQGPWRKIIFQFQQYRVNMLAMMGKDIRDSFTGTPEEKATARRALGWMMGTQLALTGAAGTVLAPIAFAIADLFRDDDDLLDSRTDFIRSAPQWLSHGILSGVVDMSRLGADGLLSLGGDYAPKDASAKETFQYYVMANIGPWAGLGANFATGVQKALEGDHVSAVKNLAPAGVRDVYKAYFEGQQGAKDSRQVVYYDPSLWDNVTGALGLRSGSRRDAEELRGASYEASSRSQTLKNRYLGKLALGYSMGDADVIAEAKGNIADWNSQYPDMPITASMQKRAIINRQTSQLNAAEYGIAAPRAPGASMKEVLGL